MLRLSQLFNFLFFLWSGSILEPDRGPAPTAGSSGDTGSGLEPNG